MKIYIPVLLAVAALLSGAGPLRADSKYAFGITYDAKMLGAEKQQKAGVTLAKEEWVYEITIENKSFKDAQNVSIKYIIFEQPQNASEVGKSKQDMVRKQGGKEIPLMKNFEKVTFASEPIERNSVQLKPGYVWTSGSGKRQSKDSLSGLWIRVFVNGQQATEFTYPPSLSTREKWDAK